MHLQGVSTCPSTVCNLQDSTINPPIPTTSVHTLQTTNVPSVSYHLPAAWLRNLQESCVWINAMARSSNPKKQSHWFPIHLPRIVHTQMNKTFINLQATKRRSVHMMKRSKLIRIQETSTAVKQLLHSTSINNKDSLRDKRSKAKDTRTTSSTYANSHKIRGQAVGPHTQF